MNQRLVQLSRRNNASPENLTSDPWSTIPMLYLLSLIDGQTDYINVQKRCVQMKQKLFFKAVIIFTMYIIEKTTKINYCIQYTFNVNTYTCCLNY